MTSDQLFFAVRRHASCTRTKIEFVTLPCTSCRVPIGLGQYKAKPLFDWRAPPRQCVRYLSHGDWWRPVGGRAVLSANTQVCPCQRVSISRSIAPSTCQVAACMREYACSHMHIAHAFETEPHLASQRCKDYVPIVHNVNFAGRHACKKNF